MMSADYLQYEKPKKKEKQRIRRAGEQRSREKQEAEKHRSWKNRKKQ
jgi:hypothetical protein